MKNKLIYGKTKKIQETAKNTRLKIIILRRKKQSLITNDKKKKNLITNDINAR
jgi:hypothetical protein